jgi:hypothetical protein
VSIIHLNRKELKLLKKLDEKYPDGVERTKELFQNAMTLEELGLADSASVSYRKSAVWITENGRQYLRDRKANKFWLPAKVAGGIVTLILIPVLVNLISDYVLPLLFG